MSDIDKSKLKVADRKIFEGLRSNNPTRVAKTAENLAGYLSTRVREDSLMRNIFDYETYTSADLDPQINVEEPTVLVYFEPFMPKTYSVPFSDDANALEFTGRRAALIFSMITTSKFRKTKFSLMSDPGDIRSHIENEMKFELLDTEDVRVKEWIDAFVGDAGVMPDKTDVDNPLHRNIYGEFSPELLTEVCNILPRSRDASGQAFSTHTLVMNRLLASKFKTWDNITLSDNTLEEIEDRGWTRASFHDVDIIVTAKTHVIPENEILCLGPRDELGRAGMLEDITLYTDAEGQMLEFYGAWAPGVCLNPYSFAKATLPDIS